MDSATFAVQCLNALQYGLLLFLIASGLTLIFGVMGVINLAHGSFYMIGAYMAYALAPALGGTAGLGFIATLLVGLVLAVALGYALEWAFFSFLYEREHLQQVLMTYGLILVFEELRSLRSATTCTASRCRVVVGKHRAGRAHVRIPSTGSSSPGCAWRWHSRCMPSSRARAWAWRSAPAAPTARWSPPSAST
jgi:branched-subunit amino acid ABC-type transport system permease component